MRWVCHPTPKKRCRALSCAREFFGLLLRWTRRRRHELGADRVNDECIDNAVDRLKRGGVQFPTADAGYCGKLLGTARAPECYRDERSIQGPANRQFENSLAVIFSRKAVQALYGFEVLRIPWRLKFWIYLAEIVAIKLSVWFYLSAQ